MKHCSTNVVTFALLAAVALSLTACGYALVGLSSTLPEDVQDVYVRALANQTGRSQVDQILTRAIAQEFVSRQRFQVVNSAAEADAVLSGTVTSFRISPISFGGAGRARQYQVTIGADMVFKRTGVEGEVLWERKAYQFRETFESEISAADFFSQEDQKIEELSERFAETLIIDLLEGF